VLRCAAVLGADFEFPTLVEVCGLDDRQVETLLHTCVQQQLLEEDPAAGGRYRFRHALTREAIYEDMTAPARARLHIRAADALAAQPTVSPAERARHLVSAGRFADAAPLLIAAAEEATHRLGYEEAAALYRRALPHVQDRLELARLHCRLGEALWYGRDPATARDYLEEGIAELELLDKADEAAGYLLVLGRCRWELADSTGARADYERARDLLEPLGSSENLAMSYVRLAGIHAFNREGDLAVQAGQRAVAIAEACGADAPRIWAYNYIGLGLDVQPGHTDEAIAYLDRSHREADARGLSWIAGNALHNGLVTRYSNRRALGCAPRRLSGLVPGGSPERDRWLSGIRGRPADPWGQPRVGSAKPGIGALRYGPPR
jgi:predicted ATPase